MECAICYGRGSLISEDNIFKFGLDWETRLHALLTRVTGFTGCFSMFSTKRLIKYIDDFKPDIVNIHEMHAYFVNIKPLLEYLAKKRILTVFTLHCEYNYTGKCGHALGCEKWKNRCGKCPLLHKYPKVLFFDHTKYMHKQKEELFKLHSGAVITTVSPWLTERAEQSFLKKRTIYTIYNGIDTNVFFPRNIDQLKCKMGLADKKVVVGIASNIMNNEKGGQYLEKLAQNMPELSFLFVGTDEKKIRRKDNVIYIPKVMNKEELAEYYSVGDVFVICSLKETFSLTCAEALCCGTPIAGFECGAPETIFEEPYAFFVEYGDVEALKQAVYKQLKNKAEGISQYGQRFSTINMLDKYIKIYQDLINFNRRNIIGSYRESSENYYCSTNY